MTFLLRLLIVAFLTAGVGMLGKVNAFELGSGNGKSLIPDFRSLMYSNPELYNEIVNGDRTPRVMKRDEYPLAWIVATYDGKAVTNGDLEKFIESSKLSDSRMIQLFKQAGGDYNKYQQLKSDWVYSWWRAALKQFLYYKMLEKEAKRQGRERRAFRTTKNEFWDATDKAERDVLKTLLDEGKGIRYAREKYAEFLREQDYPHESGESLEDTYFRWLKVLKARIREQIRLREVEKMEFFQAHPKAKANYYQPISAIYDLNQQAREQVRGIFERDDLNDQKLSELLNQNPLAMTVIKRMESISLRETPLKRYIDKKPSKLREALSQLDTGKLTDEAILEQMAKYEKIAFNLSQKYDSIEKLEQLEKQSLDKFMGRPDGDYRSLVLSKLYQLARFQKEETQNRELITLQVVEEIREAQKSLGDLVTPNSIFEEKSGLIFPHYVEAKIRQSLGLKDDQTADFRNALLNLGIWMIKFQAKNMARADRPVFTFEFREYKNYESQKYLEQYWLAKEFEKNLKKFQERTLKRKNRYSIQINPEGNHRWDSSASVDFVFQ